MNKLFLEPKLEFNTGNNKEYKIEIIRNYAIYAKKAEKYLLSLYYLVFWKTIQRKKILENLFLQLCIFGK